MTISTAQLLTPTQAHSPRDDKTVEATPQGKSGQCATIDKKGFHRRLLSWATRQEYAGLRNLTLHPTGASSG